MVAAPGAAPRQTTVRRCSALVTVATRMRASLPSAATASLPAMAAPPPMTAPAAAATTSRHAAALASKVVAGHLVVAPP